LRPDEVEEMREAGGRIAARVGELRKDYLVWARGG